MMTNEEDDQGSQSDDNDDDAVEEHTTLKCNKEHSNMTLTELAEKYKPSKFWKYAHSNFDRIYPLFLEQYRYKRFRMLEIGLDSGAGSLLCREYFPCAELYGLEKNEGAATTDGASSIRTIVGDQGDREFLEGRFMEEADGGNFDVIVDDGGHHYEQQRTSYEVLFHKALRPGGVYILENVETSYYEKGEVVYDIPVTRGGCNKQTKTMMNLFKKLVDVINKKFYDNRAMVFGPVDHLVATMTIMSNLVVLTKKDETHCFSELGYIWPQKLSKDCPARYQDEKVLESSLIKEMCGNAILQRDRKKGRGAWNNATRRKTSD